MLRPISTACLGLLMLSGCGPSGMTDTNVKRVRIQAVADPVEAEAYRALIASFEQANPDVRVELITVGRQREHVTKLATSFAGGNPPDLFLINYRRYGQFLGKGLLDPLGPRLAEKGAFAAEDFFAPALEAFQYQGQQLCLPQNISTQVVYYNRGLFSRFDVPEPADDWSWKEFHDASRDLTRDTDGDRAADIFGFDFDPDLVHMAPFVWQAGGQIVDDTASPRRLMLKDHKAVMGLMFPKRLRTEVGVMPPLAQRRALGPEQRFIRGELAMTIQSRRFATTLREVKDLDWDVAPLPRHKVAATLLHADAYCLTTASQQPDAAARFVAFALSEEGQGRLTQSGRIVPSRKSVARSGVFLDPSQPPARAQVFLNNIDIVRRLPVTPYWYELETRVKPVIEEWVFESPPQGKTELTTGLHDGYRLIRLIETAVGNLMEKP